MPPVPRFVSEPPIQLSRYLTQTIQLGIQFVQIGTDTDATNFLKKLDDDFGKRVSPIFTHSLEDDLTESSAGHRRYCALQWCGPHR